MFRGRYITERYNVQGYITDTGYSTESYNIQGYSTDGVEYRALYYSGVLYRWGYSKVCDNVQGYCTEGGTEKIVTMFRGAIQRGLEYIGHSSTGGDVQYNAGHKTLHKCHRPLTENLPCILMW